MHRHSVCKYERHLTLINERDGGVNGVKIVHEECETGIILKLVSNDEKMKSKNPVTVFQPRYYYQLTKPMDRYRCHNGLWKNIQLLDRFSVFNFPATYWSQAAVSYIAGKKVD